MKKLNLIEQLKNYYLKIFPLIYSHTENVAKISELLAKKYKINLEKTLIAAWGHDIFRLLSDKELEKYKNKYKKRLGFLTKVKAPIILYHGPLASILFPKLFNYGNKEVLKAIKYHSILSKNPKPIEAIIFIADKLDPVKNKRNSNSMLKTCMADLDKGLYDIINSIIFHNCNNNIRVHGNFYLLKNKYEKKKKIISW
jgi:HD superfamily phosphohydrolase YqeK